MPSYAKTKCRQVFARIKVARRSRDGGVKIRQMQKFTAIGGMRACRPTREPKHLAGRCAHTPPSVTINRKIYATDKYIRHPVYTHSGKRILDIKKHLDFSGCLFTFLYFFLLGAIVLLNILHMFFCPIRSIFFYAFDSAIMYSVIIQFIFVRGKD